MGGVQGRGPLAAELSRRDFIARATTLGAGAYVLAALPAARLIQTAAAPSLPTDATLQAFADTIIPGRKASKTDLGDPIDPRAIAGVDSEPGAVEADALRLYHDPLIGFDALEAPFLADLSARAAEAGGAFLLLPYEKRVQVLLAGLDFGNPTRTLWEAAAAVPFEAFCGAGEHPIGTSANASGYRVMGYPGAAPGGYQRDFSYRRKLSRERTGGGSLP
jgi:hypothetical protein